MTKQIDDDDFGRRLREIEVSQAVIKQQVNDIHGWMKGSDKEPSVPIRLDRLERFVKGYVRIKWLAMTAIISAACTWVGTVLFGPK